MNFDLNPLIKQVRTNRGKERFFVESFLRNINKDYSATASLLLEVLKDLGKGDTAAAISKLGGGVPAADKILNYPPKTKREPDVEPKPAPTGPLTRAVEATFGVGPSLEERLEPIAEEERAALSMNSAEVHGMIREKAAEARQTAVIKDALSRPVRTRPGFPLERDGGGR